MNNRNVEERLRNRRFLSAAEIYRILQEHKDSLCRQLCSGETCDRCRIHKNESCRLTPVLGAIGNLGLEILEEDNAATS